MSLYVVQCAATADRSEPGRLGGIGGICANWISASGPHPVRRFCANHQDQARKRKKRGKKKREKR